MKKALSLALSTALLASMAAAAPAAAAENPVTVSIMCAYASEDPHGQYVYQYADAFMESHPDVTIEIQAISSNDIYAKLASMATAPDDLPTLFWSSVDMAPSEIDIGIERAWTDILMKKQEHPSQMGFWKEHPLTEKSPSIRSTYSPVP